jgi:hypothetical protein
MPHSSHSQPAEEAKVMEERKSWCAIGKEMRERCEDEEVQGSRYYMIITFVYLKFGFRKDPSITLHNQQPPPF